MADLPPEKNICTSTGTQDNDQRDEQALCVSWKVPVEDGIAMIKISVDLQIIAKN